MFSEQTPVITNYSLLLAEKVMWVGNGTAFLSQNVSNQNILLKVANNNF
jgi:hypothetical protein